MLSITGWYICQQSYIGKLYIFYISSQYDIWWKFDTFVLWTSFDSQTNIDSWPHYNVDVCSFINIDITMFLFYLCLLLWQVNISFINNFKLCLQTINIHNLGLSVTGFVHQTISLKSEHTYYQLRKNARNDGNIDVNTS